MSGAAAGRDAQEVRIDPEDGQPRTFQELQAACKGTYTEAEIEEYWNMTMLKHSGDSMHNVSNDPFMTHVSAMKASAPARAGGRQTLLPPSAVGAASSAAGAAQTRSAGAAEEADVGHDPFLTADGRFDVANVRQDPFLTHQGRQGAASVQSDYDVGGGVVGGLSRRDRMKQAALNAKRHWSESLFRLLGPGDATRDAAVRNKMLLGPWLIFMWVFIVQVLVRHWSEVLCFGVSVLILFGACTAGLSWYAGRRNGPVSLLSVGVLGSLAVVAGMYAGQQGWELHWRQYWWTHTGFRGEVTTASTPALAREDFAVVNFWDSNAGTTFNDTRVDPFRSMGFKDTDFYCVAPVLSPDTAGATLVRVNFWAVGINCCQSQGGFTCDDSREYDAGAGVVMLDGGYPCPSCNAEKFRAAVTKAEAVHGLVSASGAQFVRWVKTPGVVERDIFWGCFGYLLLWTLHAGLVFSVLGWLAWYYGCGIQITEKGAVDVNTEGLEGYGSTAAADAGRATILPEMSRLDPALGRLGPPSAAELGRQKRV